MEGCIFCEKLAKKEYNPVLTKFNHFEVIFDGFPVTEGHALIIPKRHVEKITELSIGEWLDLRDIIKQLESLYQAQGVLDYNVGLNCGPNAGQTVPHLHIHFIPRRKGDCENPRGGVRGVIPNKQSY